jgi:hypothetical protein
MKYERTSRETDTNLSSNTEVNAITYQYQALFKWQRYHVLGLTVFSVIFTRRPLPPLQHDQRRAGSIPL